MKKIALTLLLLLAFKTAICQTEQKLNVQLDKFNLRCEIDTSVWRIVKYKEYLEQNLGSLDFLSDSTIVFFNGYVLKDSSNIMNPPVIMIQSTKVPEDVSMETLKKQADTIITKSKKLFTEWTQELKSGNKITGTLLDYFLKSSNYFDADLNAFIDQMKVPGANGEFNIIHTAFFIEKGQVFSIKMIYLENSQLIYFTKFNQLLKTIKFE